MTDLQAEAELCRKEYKKQRKLEQFVCKRTLERPNTKKWHVIVWFSAVPFLLFCAVLISLQFTALNRYLVLMLLILSTWELYIRFCLIQSVKCYQHYAKEETRRRCTCVPSCSEYAVLCLKSPFPLAIALIKIRIRLYKTCNGEDYKLDFPFEKMNRVFERDHLN